MSTRSESALGDVAHRALRAGCLWVCLCIAAGAAAADGGIHFKRGSVDPASLPAPRAVQRLNTGHHVLQFAHAPDESVREQLRQLGVLLLVPVPERAYWVAVKADVLVADVEALAGPLSAAWQPAASFRLSAELSGAIAERARLDDGRIEVLALFFEDQTPARIAAMLHGAGVELLDWPAPHLARVRLQPDQLQQLAELDAVHWIEPRAAPNQTLNQTAAVRIRANTLLAPPYSLSGAGLAAGIWDGGPVAAHGDYAARLIVQNGGTVDGHATHVAGTLAGSGAGDASARGMAPSLQLHSYDWTNDLSEMRAASGLVLSNHSYGQIAGWWLNPANSQWTDTGAGGFGEYSSTAAAWDDVVYDTGLITFNAAGNDRGDGPDCPAGPRCDGPYDTIASQASAKNTITICATTDFDGMTSFSSWGPVNDGRIKPDLCANGSSLWSTRSPAGYEYRSGTSMATPSAAGAAALLIQHLFNETGARPAPHTLKALMVHGARDLGRAGPDYEFGWGLIDASASVALIDQQRWLVDQLSTTGPTTLNLPITVAAGTPSLKATVVWTDPQGSPGAATALVNNLDLSLIAPDGATHLPWRLNPAAPSAPATRGSNSLDNVEQVVVDSPPAGNWIVRLSGSLPSGPQAYALVADGLATPVIGEGGWQSGTLPVAARTTAWQYYRMDLPAGTTWASVSLSGMARDADLYVRRGQRPTLAQKDCASTQGGTNAEGCALSAATLGPLAGRWYIGVTNFDSLNTINYRVSANWLPGSGAANVNTGQATSISQTAALLTGVVNAGGVTTAVRFEYGSSSALGSSTPPSNAFGSFIRDFQYSLSGLQCGLTYHFRAVASNATGTSYGPTRTFSTAACPLEVVELQNGVVATGTLFTGDILTQWRYFAIDVPANAVELRVETQDRQLDTYFVVRREALPSYETFDCRRYASAGASVVSCPFSASSTPALTPGRWYVGVSNAIDGHLFLAPRSFGVVARLTTTTIFANGFE